jgi:hypothetical protein
MTENMKHHHEAEENYNYIYNLVGLFSGLFIGVVLNGNIFQIAILGIVGFLFARFFVKTLVDGSENS